MIEKVSVSEDPITFKKLGRILPKRPKKKPKFRIQILEFAQFGFCPYTAWHVAEGTTPIMIAKVKRAQTIGKIIHDELDRKHEEETAKLPKATEKTRLDKYKPLKFPRNFPVFLYHKPFLYVGRIDNICRKANGNFYITEDKTTKRAPYWPWGDHLIQVQAYCAGMANTYWRRYNAQYLCWHIRYLDRSSREHLNDFEGIYGDTSHKNLLDSLKNFETIYQGNNPGFEVNPNKCKVCKFSNTCSFKM